MAVPVLAAGAAGGVLDTARGHDDDGASDGPAGAAREESLLLCAALALRYGDNRPARSEAIG